MARLIINSQLTCFQLVRRVTAVSNQRIEAVAEFSKWPIYTGLEVMAQLAALHVRHSLTFERHAFLLSVDRCDLPLLETLDGDFYLTAERVSQSSQVFAYRTTTRGPDDLTIRARLLIGTQVYDERFKEDRLKQYYRKIFEDLQAGGNRS